MSLKGKHFISTGDFAPADLDQLIALAKARKHGGATTKPLAGKSVALIFFNPSLRTRTSFELAIQALGGTAVTMNVGSDSWTLEHRDGAVMDGGRTEHVKDAVKVLSRFVDAVGVRCFAGMESPTDDLADSVIQSFKRHSDVPVLNLESSLWHPCQALADLMTVHEKRGAVRNQKVVLTWAPHPKSLPTAVPDSFVLAMAQMGAEVTLVHPPEFPLPKPVMDQAERAAAAAGKRVRVMNIQNEALVGAQVVSAKAWGGINHYGRREEESYIRTTYKSWMLDERKMSLSSEAVFLHCLPVRRNVEVSDGVLDGRGSAIYDEAENRLWVQQALLEAVL